MNAAESESPGAGFVGDTTRPQLANFADAVLPLVDECRLHATEDGFHVAAVDAVNVGIVEADLALSAIAEDEQTVGLNLHGLRSHLTALQDFHARECWLEVDQADRTLAIDHDTGMVTMDCIDEDKVRDDPSPPEVDYTATCRADLSVLQTFGEHLPDGSHAVTIETSDGRDSALHLSVETDEFEMQCDVPGTIIDATGDPATGTYSSDYVRSIFEALPNRMGTVKLGDEVPIAIAYRGDLSVEYVLAPRITAGDDE